MVADRGRERLAVVLKVRTDARLTLLRASLAEALLGASAAIVARRDGFLWRSVAVVGAPRLTGEMVDRLRRDVQALLKGLPGSEQIGPAWGVSDGMGRVLLEGQGLDLRRQPSRTPSRPPRVTEPFTDRRQWALKVLFAPHLPREAIGFPQATYPSANALARAAHVSVSTAANAVRYLREHGHLVEAAGTLDVRRLPELQQLWKQRTPPPAISCGADFRLPTGDPEGRARRALLDLRGPRENAAGPSRRSRAPGCR